MRRTIPTRHSNIERWFKVVTVRACPRHQRVPFCVRGGTGGPTSWSRRRPRGSRARATTRRRWPSSRRSWASPPAASTTTSVARRRCCGGSAWSSPSRCTRARSTRSRASTTRPTGCARWSTCGSQHVVEHRDHMLVFQQERHVIEAGAQWRDVRTSRKRFEELVDGVLAELQDDPRARFADRRVALFALLGHGQPHRAVVPPARAAVGGRGRRRLRRAARRLRRQRSAASVSAAGPSTSRMRSGSASASSRSAPF